MSMYLKSQSYPVQWDFQTSEKEFLRMQNFLKEKFKKQIHFWIHVWSTANISQCLNYKDDKFIIKKAP